MSTQAHDQVFVINAGHQISEGGKCSFPNQMKLRLRRDNALNFAMGILSALQESTEFTPNDEFLPDFVIEGEIETETSDADQPAGLSA